MVNNYILWYYKFRKTNKRKGVDMPTNISNNNLNDNNNKKPWYKKMWVITLLSIFLFPIGIFLLWKCTHFTRLRKGILTFIFAILFIAIMAQPNGTGKNNNNIEEESSIVSADNADTESTTTEATITEPPTTEPPTTEPPTTEPPTTEPPTTEVPNTPKVWVSNTGSKYHSQSSCSNMKNPRQISLNDAKTRGLDACKKCY